MLEQVPFASGYALELALLADLLDLVGLQGLAQVDLGRRVHRNRSDAELGVMASAIWQIALDRLGVGAAATDPVRPQRCRLRGDDIKT